MAIAIKRIPTLTNKEAKSFVDKADKAVSKKESINFSKEFASAKAILEKANLSK